MATMIIQPARSFIIFGKAGNPKIAAGIIVIEANPAQLAAATAQVVDEFSAAAIALGATPASMTAVDVVDAANSAVNAVNAVNDKNPQYGKIKFYSSFSSVPTFSHQVIVS